MITRKGLSQSGAPPGKKWAMKCLGLWAADEMIRASHKGRPKARVKNRCEVNLKKYGIIPSRFTVMIVRNREEKINEEVRIILELVRPVCSFMIDRVELIENEFKDRLFLNIIRRKGINVIIINNSDMCLREEILGSKDEKISISIKIWIGVQLKLWRLLVYLT